MSKPAFRKVDKTLVRLRSFICNFLFLDVNLEPFVTYEYRVAAWNSYGRGFSEISRAVTKQDVPQGVSPPKWAKVDNREDMILLNWEEPLQPNGIDMGVF